MILLIALLNRFGVKVADIFKFSVLSIHLNY